MLLPQANLSSFSDYVTFLSLNTSSATTANFLRGDVSKASLDRAAAVL